MKKALLIASVLFIAVISTACINNIAVQELNNKAAEYMQKGDYEAAVNRLQASIDLDSSMYETYYNLGIAATKAKKFEVAIESLENGLKIKPDYTDFYYSLGAAQAEYAESLEEIELEKANRTVNKDIDIEEEVVDNTQKISELKKSAVENLQKYLELNPQAEEKTDIEEIIKQCTEVEKTAE